jgi:hypothetical protein
MEAGPVREPMRVPAILSAKGAERWKSKEFARRQLVANKPAAEAEAAWSAAQDTPRIRKPTPVEQAQRDMLRNAPAADPGDPRTWKPSEVQDMVRLLSTIKQLGK